MGVLASIAGAVLGLLTLLVSLVSRLPRDTTTTTAVAYQTENHNVLWIIAFCFGYDTDPRSLYLNNMVWYTKYALLHFTWTLDDPSKKVHYDREL